MSPAQALELLRELFRKRMDRHQRTRTFYAVALSAGHDMAMMTLLVQALSAAGSAVFGLYLLYQSRPFEGTVCFFVAAGLISSMVAAFRRYQAFKETDEVGEEEVPAVVHTLGREKSAKAAPRRAA